MYGHFVHGRSGYVDTAPVTALTNDMPEFLVYEKAQAEGFQRITFNVVQILSENNTYYDYNKQDTCSTNNKIGSLDDLLQCPPGIVKPLVNGVLAQKLLTS